MDGFLEKTVEQIIHENYENLHERGFIDLRGGHMDRQVRVESGKIFDLFFVGRERVVVLELKKGCVDERSLVQLVSYLIETGNNKIKFGDNLGKQIKECYKINGVLVGKTVSPNLLFLLPFICGINLRIYTYSYRFDGIHFSEEYSTNNKAIL